MQQLWKICMYQTTSWKWVEMSWITAKVSSYFTTFEKQMRCGSSSKCFSTAFTMVLLALQDISICILAQGFLFLLASLLCKGTKGMKWCNIFSINVIKLKSGKVFSICGKWNIENKVRASYSQYLLQHPTAGGQKISKKPKTPLKEISFKNLTVQFFPLAFYKAQPTLFVSTNGNLLSLINHCLAVSAFLNKTQQWA